MTVDLQEEEMIQEYREGLKEKEEGVSEISGGVKMSKKELDHEYNNLDLSKYNDKK